MLSYQLLQGMLQLSTKHKASIERALQDFMNIAAQVILFKTNHLIINLFFKKNWAIPGLFSYFLSFKYCIDTDCCKFADDWI